MHDTHRIVGVHVTDRVRRAGQVQQVLSEYGCSIKTRLGLHPVDENVCSPNGLILLELFGDDAPCRTLVDKLTAIEGVEVQQMVFEHP
jgi:hypothetical protein